MLDILKSLFTENTLYYTVALIIVFLCIGAYYIYTELNRTKRSIVFLKEHTSRIKSNHDSINDCKRMIGTLIEKKPVVPQSESPEPPPKEVIETPVVPEPIPIENKSEEIMGTPIQMLDSDDDDEIEEIPMKKK